jgi:hypothetical protein
MFTAGPVLDVIFQQKGTIAIFFWEEKLIAPLIATPKVASIGSPISDYDIVVG